MGYAYALGMLEVLKGKVPFGVFYIIAPENAKSGQVLLSKLELSSFEKVWQYGSNEEKDPPCQQDGIAPQGPVHKDIKFELSKEGRYGRIGIPDPAFKDFLKAHYIDDYEWIFNLKELEAGHVKNR